MNHLRRQGYLYVTGALATGSLLGQWLTHDGTTMEFWNAVLENWQSEFLQLCWQVGGLMFLLAVGSSQSRNESERLEAKIDFLLAIHGYASDAERLDREHDRV